MVSHRGSLWALQRFNNKHVVLCSISNAPDLHGRFTTSGFVAVKGVHTSCFLLVSCFCSYTTWTDVVLFCLMWILAWCHTISPHLACCLIIFHSIHNIYRILVFFFKLSDLDNELCFTHSSLWLFIHLTLADSIGASIVTSVCVCVCGQDISLAFAHKVKVKQLLLGHLKDKSGLYWQYQQRLPCLIFLQFALGQRLPAGKGSWNNYKIIIAHTSTWENLLAWYCLQRFCRSLASKQSSFPFLPHLSSSSTLTVQGLVDNINRD